MDEVFLKAVWGETAVAEWHESVPRLVRASEGNDPLCEMDYEEAEEILAEVSELAGTLAVSEGMSLTGVVDVMVAVLQVLTRNGFLVVPHHVVLGVRYMIFGVVKVESLYYGGGGDE